MEDIRLIEIGGLLTEKSVWQMLYDLTSSNTVPSNACAEDVIVKSNGHFTIGNVQHGKAKQGNAFHAPEYQEGQASEASGIWTLGALSFFAIMGVDIFEGKGGISQTSATEIPRIGSAHASHDLSQLIYKCLNYNPSDRPNKAFIHTMAEKHLQMPSKPRKRLVSSTGKSYASSLISFWPEEMGAIAIIVMLFLAPLGIFAQERLTIPNEMGNLVRSCISLRTSGNKDKVQRDLQRDTKWTMMDEIAVDRNGECTTKDKVDMFGLNSIGFRVLKQHNGVTNSGGRFRDGRDQRYKYSLIEITVKKGASVSYNITGRDGSQLFAIIPHADNAKFTASLSKQGKQVATGIKQDGICYLQLKNSKLKKSDTIKLSLKNLSGKNMAFVIINYNSRDHE